MKMAEPTDAILPVLKNIQDSVLTVRKEQQSAKERLIAITDAVHEVQDVVSEIRGDNLAHLGLTTRHRMDFERLQGDMAELKSRIAVLESRS
jgi:DNA gyrase/topoisomerase IV subunit A